MIAVDTNILVYAHRPESTWHASARELMRGLAEGNERWALPSHCLHEFFGIVTHPRIYRPATPATHAIDQIEAWLSSPSVVVLQEDAATWTFVRVLLRAAPFVGGAIHDARVAAVCLQHKVTELWTNDRDFAGFAPLRARNPLAPTKARERRARYELRPSRKTTTARLG